MKHLTIFKQSVCSIILLVLFLSVPVMAQTNRPFGRGIYGDWQIKMQFGEREFESILSFSRNDDRQLTGQWITNWGMSDLKEVQFEDGKLSFTHERQTREGDTMTSKFSGTVEEGKLTGTLTSDRGETKIEGQRSGRMPRVVGNWEMKYKIGDRDITSTLVIKADKDGNLAGEWKSEWGEHEISELKYERGSLSFKRKSTMGDRQFESSFEGNIQREGLTGVFKSDRGEITVEGQKAGQDLIGTWNLDIDTEYGQMKQRLVVNPDMSGLYGAIPVEKIELKDNQVSFKIEMQFGDQKMEMSFSGTIKDQTITGETESDFGTNKISGKKVVRSFRRPTAASER